jgi:FAD/FMN-containing dehydrogenase/Fe-S oxidoreductase
VTPGGGATGTNGQSLTRGFILDTSRHLNRILSLDPAARLVTVEPGVVLNQLNAHLKPYGLFFPPNVSTASRATLGGMVATDASGKGSRIYGKTSDYIEAMDVVLADGTDWTVNRLSAEELTAAAARPDTVGRIHREVARVVRDHAGLIDATFPRMNRGLTGYNLQQVTGPDGSFSLAPLLAGSEGTLAITRHLTLRVIPVPTHRALVAVRYADFHTALRDVRRLLRAEPAAVEILDDTILGLARSDLLWSSIESVLGADPADNRPIGGLNFVEFVGDSAEAVERQCAALAHILTAAEEETLGWTVVTDPHLVGQLWSLREKSVGLLGRLGGGKPGIPFVEDTAVPPEKLADYVAEFRALLDSHGLAYGMFGHADVGCLHVRPALDMKRPEDAALIRPISDGVAALTRKYGGLLWGEHGRGFRGEYSPFFFGPVLYAELCRIKQAFDPDNRLNPGKLAAPEGQGAVDRIDGVPLRGAFDRTIAPPLAAEYAGALACNGNGACFNWDAADPMCPSYKATRDRVQSPKGRASLLREWARLDSKGPSPDLAGVEAQVKQSLATCLSCKACASQCPIKVDVPALKSRFLHRYHQKHRRPLRDYLAAAMESLLPLARRFPRLSALVMTSGAGRRVLERVFALTDLPAIVPPTDHARPVADLPRLSAADRQRAVILLEDSFTSSFDGQTVTAVRTLLTRLGYVVLSAAPQANGKALHVLGMRDRFSAVARRARARLADLTASGLPVIGIEAVARLMHSHEYAEEGAPTGTLLSLEAFLADELAAGRLTLPAPKEAAPLRLLLHCTEKTMKPQTAELWRKVFSGFGLKLETPATGCCGMAGLFGHETEHQTLSKQLFNMSWNAQVSGIQQNRLLVTGFSCRCQTERFADFRPRHPAEALLDLLDQRD